MTAQQIAEHHAQRTERRDAAIRAFWSNHPLNLTFRQWWDTARDLVGGDDFCETLPWAEEIKTMIDSGARQIVIECKRDSVRLVTFNRRTN